MSDVLTFLREREPRFNDVSNDELTAFAGDVHPEFLADDQFNADYGRIRYGITPELSEQVQREAELPTIGPSKLTARDLIGRKVREFFEPIFGRSADRIAELKTAWGEPDATDEGFLNSHPELKGQLYGIFKGEQPIPRTTAEEILSVPQAKDVTLTPLTRKLAEISAGTQNFVAGVADFMTSPGGVLSLMGAGIAPIVRQAIATGFATDMALHLPAQAKQVYEAVQRGDTTAATEGIENAALSLGVIYGGAKALSLREAGESEPSRRATIEATRAANSPATADALERVSEIQAAPPTLEEPKSLREAQGVPQATEIKPAPESAAPEENTAEAMAQRAQEALAAQAAPTEPAATPSPVAVESPELQSLLKQLRQAQEEHQQKLNRLKELEEQGRYGYQLRMPKMAIRLSIAKIADLQRAIAEARTRAPAVTSTTAEPTATTPTRATEEAQSEVTSKAGSEGQRSADDVKADLIAEIQERLAKAPSDLNAVPIEQRKVTIDIPGDGTFTVWNSVEALSELLARAKRIKTTVKAPGVPKDAIKNSAQAISKMAGENENIRRAQAPGLPQGTEPPPATGLGPGAMAGGEPPYSAIAQLTDAIKATPKVGARESLSLKERAADAWSATKTIWEKSLGKLRSTSEWLKETGRGVRNVTDLDRRLGEFDYALQKSAAQSRAAGQAIERQMPNGTLRDATAIWIDAGGDETAIRDALTKLPESTSGRVRRAVELAANLPQEGKQFAESLRQFYGVRADDAKASDIFEHALDDYYTHVWQREENMPDALRGAISSGRVSTYFQFARQRKISTLLEGILQGKTPELDPAKVIPFYNYALDRAIASRRLIREASDLTASDERPALAPTGVGVSVERGTADESLLIKPRAKPEAIGDYRSIDHPALRKWKWADTDETGKTTFVQSDLVVHPEFYERLARMMDRPRLTPTKAGRVDLRLGGEVKAAKLGLLSAFHQIHVGSHALWHWTNPFKAPEIDWDAPATKFAVEKGHLKLGPNPQELNVFAEGIMSPGLVHKIPMLGPWSRAYSHWLFTDYIPRLKLATFENALRRNREAYSGKLASGKLTPDELAARVGDSVNNAYGELNQLFLGRYGRDPRFQRLLQGIFLAPDFGEARLRFVTKAATRYGGEERFALATAFVTLYTAARVGNFVSHGDPEWDWKRAFAVKVGDHWWSMRSVIGDVLHAVANFGQFLRVRLSPLYSRTGLELLTGRNDRGQKVDAGEQLKDVAKQLVPIQLGGLTREDQRVWESFVTAMGLSATREDVVQEMHKSATDWLKQNDFEPPAEIISKPGGYNSLRTAIRQGHAAKALEIIQDLRKTHSDQQIEQAMHAQVTRPFTGSKEHEKAWVDGMSPKESLHYEQARELQRQEYEKFLELWDKRKRY